MLLVAIAAGISGASATGGIPENAVNLTMQQNASDPAQIIVDVNYSDDLQDVDQDIAVDAKLELLSGNITGAKIKWYYTGNLSGPFANYTVLEEDSVVWLSSFTNAPVRQGQAKLYMEDGKSYRWLFVIENATGKVFTVRANSTAFKMVNGSPANETVLNSTQLTVDLRPHFTLENLTVTPVSGNAPLNVTVTVKVTNTGVADDFTAELMVNGEVKDTETVNVKTGETVTVTFTYTLPAGLYNVTVNDLAPVSVTSIPAAPAASPAPGIYRNNVTVTLTGPEGSVIYYTLNGSNPTINSTRYTAPVLLTKSATLKFIAVVNGASSAVSSASYTVMKPVTLSYYVKVKVKKWYRKWYRYMGKWRYKWRYYWTYRYVKRTSSYWQIT
ncbi:chitobiase/beta-hexosaminidase C-terminal domain-containing protein [Methanothermobacter sp. KEPCO 2]|uniref:chitobiase/beta-hexosaminidase C-terminal domain-containing protein n=1 Tax=Methanothermobacter sp. KEPCO 2 TaxID=3240977 RepID=UPI00351149E8